MLTTLSLPEARRLAVASQAFGERRSNYMMPGSLRSPAVTISNDCTMSPSV